MCLALSKRQIYNGIQKSFTQRHWRKKWSQHHIRMELRVANRWATWNKITILRLTVVVYGLHLASLHVLRQCRWAQTGNGGTKIWGGSIQVIDFQTRMFVIYYRNRLVPTYIYNTYMSMVSSANITHCNPPQAIFRERRNIGFYLKTNWHLNLG